MTPSSILTKINGDNIHDRNPDALLLEMDFETRVNAHARCLLRYRQTRDRPFDLKEFQGGFVEVHAVMPDGADSEMFEGWVEQARLRFEPNGSHVLELVCYSYSLDLDRRPLFHTYSGSVVTMEDKVNRMKELCEALMIDPVVFAKDAERTETFARPYQLGETCWQHLLAECCDAGLMVYPLFRNLWVTDHFTDDELDLGWSVEGGLVDFEVVTSAQMGRRYVVSYDREPATSKLVADVIGPKPPSFGTMTELCDVLWDEATSEANKGARPEVAMEGHELNQIWMKMDSQQAYCRTIRGVGHTREVRMLPGWAFTISGPVPFAGKWGIVAVKHTWTPNGYMNEFECTPFDMAAAPEPGTLPAFLQTVRGRVLTPPNEEDRVQVQMPWEDDPAGSLYWPWLSNNTGAGRGISFPPEIGDEVVMAFTNGVGKSAYIAAAAWNKVDRVPLEPLFGKERDNNDIKRIVTKSGNRLVMDDKDGKEAIVMATPNHVRVSLFDGGSTLLLHSDGDIKIHAGGTVHMKCAQFLREVG